MNIKGGIEESLERLQERREAMVKRKAPKGVIESVDKRIEFARKMLREQKGGNGNANSGE